MADTQADNHDPSETAWMRVAAEKSVALSRLSGTQHAGAARSPTFDELRQSLSDLHQKYSPRLRTSWFTRMEPVLSRLHNLSKAVSVINPSAPGVSSLVLGGVHVILDAASSFSHTFIMIIDMLEKITSAMPRFEEYMQLYPEREGLQIALRSVYSGYLDFCISAAKFFRHGFIVQLLGSYISPGSLQTTFRRIVAQMQRATAEFESEAQLAHAVSNKLQLTRLAEALPHVDILPKRRGSILSLPWPQNGRFFGREAELAQLTENLRPAVSEQTSCVLHGTAGVGKTHTALELCYRSRECFQFIFWIPSQDDAQLQDAYRGICSRGARTAAPGAGGSDSPLAEVAKSYQWLCDHQNWLLVFDNVNSAEALNPYWPACGHGSILITTQYRKVAHRARFELHLKGLAEDEGVSLLLRHIPDRRSLDEEVGRHPERGRAISRGAQGLPLVLIGIAGHMDDSHLSLAEMLLELKLAAWKENHFLDALGPESAAFQYEKPIDTAFNVSLNKITPGAMAVLRVMSMLAADEIPEMLFLGESNEAGSRFLGHSDRSRFYREIGAPLLTRHLIELHPVREPNDNPTFSLHRLLQNKVLRDMRSDPAGRQEVFDHTVAMISRLVPPLSEYMVPVDNDWALYKKSIGHVICLEETFRFCNKVPPALQGSTEFAELLTSAGFYLYQASLSESCSNILGTAQQICQQISSQKARESPVSQALETSRGEPPEIIASSPRALAKAAKVEASALNILWAIAMTSQGPGGREQGLEWISNVVSLREHHSSLPHDSKERFHSRVLLSNAYNDMAYQLLDCGRYQEAEAYLQRSSTLKNELGNEKALPAFEDVALKSNLAISKMGRGKCEEAVSLSEDALALIQREHSDGATLAQTRFVHATCLMGSGRFREALAALEEVLEARTSLFGPSGAPTRHCLYALSLAHYSLGQLDEASSAIDQCTKHQDSPSWPRECLLRANHLRALILRACGHEKESKELEGAVVSEANDILSAHAPHVLEDTPVSSLTESERLGIFDHLVPVVAGRFTRGQSEG